jgi:uncharacterized membrane protein
MKLLCMHVYPYYCYYPSLRYKNSHLQCLLKLITVAAEFIAWTFFVRSNAAIVGSNPTQGIGVYVRIFWVCVVLCVGRGLATGWSLIQIVLPTVYRGPRNWKSGQGPTYGCRATIIIIIIIIIIVIIMYLLKHFSITHNWTSH